MDRTIPYESAALPDAPPGRRPLWVLAVVGTYVLVVGGLVVVSFALPLLSHDSAYPAAAALATVLVLCELAMLFVPVRLASRRPFTRRALWVPLAASAFLVGLLGVGGALALAELAKLPDELTWVVFATGAALWTVWVVVFWLLSQSRGPDAIASRLHRWLLAGSVLELLVAVPTHVVVRRRSECCAGLASGLGICAGIAVMLLAFGPSVGFLYYRRWKQIRPQ